MLARPTQYLELVRFYCLVFADLGHFFFTQPSCDLVCLNNRCQYVSKLKLCFATVGCMKCECCATLSWCATLKGGTTSRQAFYLFSCTTEHPPSPVEKPVFEVITVPKFPRKNRIDWKTTSFSENK